MGADLIAWLKPLHIALAVVSAAGFAMRAAWMATGRQALLERRLVRVAPHVVDTGLLAAGLALAVVLRLSPLAQPWFLAKLLLVLAYIVAGMMALRRARTRTARLAWLAAALACLALVFATAITHRPLALP